MVGAAWIPAMGRCVLGNKRLGRLEWGLGERLGILRGCGSEQKGSLTAAAAMAATADGVRACVKPQRCFIGVQELAGEAMLSHEARGGAEGARPR
jgi:hypothetical protein